MGAQRAAVWTWEHKALVVEYSASGQVEIPEWLGQQGWELVAVLPHSSNGQQCFFKRLAL